MRERSIYTCLLLFNIYNNPNNINKVKPLTYILYIFVIIADRRGAEAQCLPVNATVCEFVSRFCSLWRLGRKQGNGVS